MMSHSFSLKENGENYLKPSQKIPCNTYFNLPHLKNNFQAFTSNPSTEQ